jgi:hypothetical protein
LLGEQKLTTDEGQYGQKCFFHLIRFKIVKGLKSLQK